ncbi:VanW family protein [Nocardioides pantholopis]|uniref:VanW family protein n=1 Tax=Nocardioides pantholopis TaxID=2483798 RepID=UPI000F07FA1E|nr:VanW family protein [Nocardioides pantholopis]
MTKTEAPPVREKAGGRVVWFVVLALVLLVGGGWAAAYAFAGDEVPHGTTIAGVDIGGQTPDEARRTLEDELAERVADPITVRVDGGEEQVSPQEAGLSVDYAGSVRAAGGGRGWNPADLWDHYTGGDDLDPVVDVDPGAMAELLDRLTGEVGTPPRDGDLRFEDGKVEIVEPRAGEQVDPAEAEAALVAAYLDPEPVATLELHTTEPDIDDADVQRALDEFANPAMSAPVTLVFGKSPVELAPRQFGPTLRMKAEDGVLVGAVDEKALGALVAGAVGKEDAPVDATVELRGNKPRVVPAKPGVTYDPASITASFLGLVTAPEGERRTEIEASVAEPEFTTEDARALGIKEQVSKFTTYYPPASYRDTNIGRAAELIDGTVLKPGETFSLNDTVGERTAENGFTTGTIISNGIFKEDLGGGVSQMATTLFNAAFFAGLEDVEHKPHSVYIDRYPVGREATVAWGAVDLRFRNDTDHGILIDAKVAKSAGRSQGVVTVRMWSTKVWKITTTTSQRYNYTAPATQVLRTDSCLPNTGYQGFDVDVKRFFTPVGEDRVVRTEKFHTTYIPSDTIVCKPPQAPSPRRGRG